MKYSLKEVKKWLESELINYHFTVSDHAKMEIVRNCTDKNIQEANNIIKDKDQKSMFE